MRKLYEFLTESINIFEASFDSSDWKKTNHTYAQDVIDVLISGKPLALASKDGKSIGDYYTATADEIELLKRLKPDYTLKTKDEFDSIFNGKLTWNKIYKGSFSGKTGDTVGQNAESCVCYFFNNGLDADISVWENELNVKLTEDWVTSSIETVKFMNSQSYGGFNWDSSNYVACHVDGKDVKFDDKFHFALEITSMFKDKKNATKLLGVNCNNLYTGQKDTWNKADIVLVKKDAIDVLDEMRKVVSDGNSLNSELLIHLSKGNIIPISLKKITDSKKAKMKGENLQEAKEEELSYIEDVWGLKIQDKFPSNEYIGTLTLLFKSLEGEAELQFRKDTNAGNGLNVEGKNSKSSRAGKALLNIKNALGLPRNNNYYIYKNTNEEAINELKRYGFDIILNKKSNYDDVKPEFKDRACVAGLLGLLEEYRNKKHPKIDSSFPEDFANFCWLCATKGSGAFFKIYEN